MTVTHITTALAAILFVIGMAIAAGYTEAQKMDILHARSCAAQGKFWVEMTSTCQDNFPR